ncbi:MAG TPA: FixH family protein [Egibacteraceae bacterium]|nr:FixH family protein [Egibacteraceae bacterium]
MKRLAVVVVVAVAGFAAAFSAFGDAARRGCVTDAPPDPTYEVAFAGPVHVGEDTHVLGVTRAGDPVTGAWVCVTIEMAGMSAMGASAEAREVGGGHYEVSLPFAMEGTWQGTVLVGAHETVADVGIPVTVEVTAGDAHGS